MSSLKLSKVNKYFVFIVTTILGLGFCFEFGAVSPNLKASVAILICIIGLCSGFDLGGSRLQKDKCLKGKGELL